MGSDLVGYFVRFNILVNETHQEIEAHVEDLKSIDFMQYFRDFYLPKDVQCSLAIKVQNLRRTLTYYGKLEFLSSEEGDFSQLVNLFIHKVS